MTDDLQTTSGSSPAPELVSSVPQFTTAEYAQPGEEKCGICSRSIGAEYFRVNGLMAREQCATEARDGQPKDSHVAFSRGLLFGVGAAIVGMIAYAAVAIITGWSIGYVALGVGWIVAKAIKKGSHGLGGRRYQVTAVLLTYAAISIATVPIGISYAIKHQKAKAAVSSQATASSQTPGTSANGAQSGTTNAPKPKVNWFGLVVQLLFLGLASPFLELQDPVHGLLGLFILFIGLRIEWQMTAQAPLEVDGPYATAATI